MRQETAYLLWQKKKKGGVYLSFISYKMFNIKISNDLNNTTIRKLGIIIFGHRLHFFCCRFQLKAEILLCAVISCFRPCKSWDGVLPSACIYRVSGKSVSLLFLFFFFSILLCFFRISIGKIWIVVILCWAPHFYF